MEISQIPKPRWLRKRLPHTPVYGKISMLLSRNNLSTVCQEARCPNQWECFSSQTSAFLILGDSCTRNCRFCAVAHGIPSPPDPDEPERISETARVMGLRYIVVTSVTRDDLPDGGADHFVQVISAIRNKIPDAMVEVLIPDFQGDAAALQKVVSARPDVLNHNIETVRRLYPAVRPEADYRRSLALLKRVHASDPEIPIKSGLMLGLGESSEEIRQTLSDLRESHCRMLTMGQYLSPSRQHLPVSCYVTPEEFDYWRRTALEMGFSKVASGPFVRSSYHARELSESKD